MEKIHNKNTICEFFFIDYINNVITKQLQNPIRCVPLWKRHQNKFLLRFEKQVIG